MEHSPTSNDIKENTLESRFQFPNEPQLIPQEMVVAKHPLDRGVPGYIPFRGAGNGRILITKILLDQLLEKEPSEKVRAGIFIEMHDFPEDDDDDNWEAHMQEYWKQEIGSFLQTLEIIGERKTFIVMPFWYISVNWEGIKTIVTTSNIEHDIYIQEERDVQYEFHLDSQLPRVNLRTERPHSVRLIDLNIFKKFKRSDSKLDTAVWLLDSEINYYHLNDDETTKVFPSYYEYSSDDNLFETKEHDLNKDPRKGEYEHGTLMCKIVSAIASNQTEIHFVKCPKLGKTNESHILRCLEYVKWKARRQKMKWNIVLITLGTEKFRCTNTQSLLYVIHEKLHKAGFLFICSAGNVKFRENVPLPRPLPEIPEYTLSLFEDCSSCIVVGAHGVTSSNLACTPSSFASCGCCTPDREDISEESFKQGVHTWAIGENVLIPKTKYQNSDRLISGTSAAAAVVAATITFILPKLLNPMENRFSNKIIFHKKLKELLEISADIFLCPKHGRTRHLIFKLSNCMEKLGY